MSLLSVWGPKRCRMDVVAGGKVYPMERDAGGWWRADVDALGPGDDYMFRLDGEATRPDPCSRYQPHGVHGPSRLVDASGFRWTEGTFRPPPLSAALIYELHVGTFTPAGTFEAAIEKLPHLVELGVTHVELMPVAEFLGERGWGYDGVYPYAPHRAYGGPAGLVKLVDACHRAGLAVLLDVVYNHFGPSGNYLPEYGPYFTDRHKTPWGTAVNFDGPYSDDVREYFIENARMWLRDYRFDGLRLDAVHAIVDTSAVPFLEQLGEEVRHLEAQLGRQLALIAESDLNDPRIVRPHEREGFGFTAQWNDDFHHAIHAALTRESQSYYCDYGGVDDLACVFGRPYLYAGRFSPHRLRSHGRPTEGAHASSFIAYSQNHDQVGNRATGERLHQLLTWDEAKIAAALTILSPYVPMLFQGEEWAATSPFQYFVDFSEDPELARAVAEGRKKEFAGFHQTQETPNPQDAATFERSKLKWEEVSEPRRREMLEWYKELVKLRRRLPQLVDGRMERIHTRCSNEQRWMVVEREGTHLAANLNSQAVALTLRNFKQGRVELSSKTVELSDSTVLLPGHSMAVVVEAACIDSSVRRAREPHLRRRRPA